nr:uncharacterized protein LOC127340047 [Lolium perenne]
MSCYCLLKIIECRSNKMFNVGFVDPDKVHHDTVKNNVEETGGNLLRFIGEQSFCDSILFPYNYSFHWILLNIQVDKGIVEVRDPLSRGLDGFRDLQKILQTCWRALKNNIAGCITEYPRGSLPRAPPGAISLRRHQIPRRTLLSPPLSSALAAVAPDPGAEGG